MPFTFQIVVNPVSTANATYGQRYNGGTIDLKNAITGLLNSKQLDEWYVCTPYITSLNHSRWANDTEGPIVGNFGFTCDNIDSTTLCTKSATSYQLGPQFSFPLGWYPYSTTGTSYQTVSNSKDTAGFLVRDLRTAQQFNWLWYGAGTNTQLNPGNNTTINNASIFVMIFNFVQVPFWERHKYSHRALK